MAEFLATYREVAREDILQNRANAAEQLGFVGRLIHGRRHDVWLRELKRRLDEAAVTVEQWN